MSDVTNNSEGIKIASYVGFGIVGVLWVAGLTYWTSTQKDVIPNNVASEQRMTTIADTFIAAFGTNWQVMFIVFAVIFLIFAALIYVISRKGVNLVLSDTHFNTYKWVGITLVALLSLIIIAGVVLIILNMTSKPDPDDPSFIPSQKQAEKNREIVGIVVIISGLLALVGLFIWYRHSHAKRKAILKTLKKKK